MINKIKQYDSNFNEGVFINKVDIIFIKLLDSIMYKDVSIIDHYANNQVCSCINGLIENYKNKKITRLFDEANIKTSRIIDFEFKNNKYIIKVELISRFMDYFINEDNGNYISGINDHRIEKVHIMTFEKDINTLDLGITVKCPTCGNSINPNENSICDFCKNIVPMEKYDYILTDIDTFKN